MHPLIKKILNLLIFSALFFISYQDVSAQGLIHLYSASQLSLGEKNKKITWQTDLRYPLLFKKDIFESTKNLSICRKKEIREYLFYYLTWHRSYLIKAIEKSYLYHEMIKEIFADHKYLPEEITLLPLLESGFNPRAYSRSKALGLWQFMRNTAKPLGLKKNYWLDERKDIEKSTLAAIRHLNFLYQEFQSWDLALAAYNSGASYLKKIIRQTKAKDIWELRNLKILNQETHEYLPKFMALILLYNNRELFGIKDEIKIPSIEKTELVTLPSPINLKMLSKYSHLSIDKIKIFNPELKRNITPPHYKRYQIRIPSSVKKIILAAKNKICKNKTGSFIKHKIKNGECLSQIAQAYDQSPQTLAEFNDLKNPHLIKAGRIIYIPN